MTKSEFYNHLCKITYNKLDYRHYLKLNSVDFVFYDTQWSLKISVDILHKSTSEFLKCTFRDSKMIRLLGKDAQVNWIKEYKLSHDVWFTVIFRNIPHFMKRDTLEDLCKQEKENVLYIGAKTNIKGIDCCLARFASLEQAETVCRRLNNLPLKFEGNRYFLKAHINPFTRLKHKDFTRSIFRELFIEDFRAKQLVQFNNPRFSSEGQMDVEEPQYCNSTDNITFKLSGSTLNRSEANVARAVAEDNRMFMSSRISEANSQAREAEWEVRTQKTRGEIYDVKYQVRRSSQAFKWEKNNKRNSMLLMSC